jgi:glycosyltransferase involved in cell wall biosynthesis
MVSHRVFTGRADICLLITSLDGGGAERVCCNLANGWAAAGREVLLVVLRPTGAFWPRLDPRVQVAVLRKQRSRQVIGTLAALLAAAPSMPVLAFGFEFGVITGLLRLLRLVANPMIYREGNNPITFISRRRRWLYPAMVSWNDRCIAQVSCVRRQLGGLGLDPSLITVIPNPVYGLTEAPVPPPRCFEDGPVLLGVGRLAPQKGFDRLISGMGPLRAVMPRARLIIAGDGAEEGRLRALAAGLGLAEAVEFAGFVDEPAELFARADLFVLASHYEGQPNALLEALGSGCRVLAAGGEPVEELMEQLGLRDCFLAPADFGRNFTEKVQAALARPETHWMEARSRLKELADPGSVAARYWTFCHQAGDGLTNGTVI